MTVEIISLLISTKVWDRAGIELATPGSAVRHASCMFVIFYQHSHMLNFYVNGLKFRAKMTFHIFLKYFGGYFLPARPLF